MLLALIPSLLLSLEGRVWAQGSTGAQLELTKLVDKAKASRGDQLTYKLILTNKGTASANNITVRDSTSTGLSYISNSATPPTGTTFTAGSPTSTWKVGSISAGQSLTLTFQAIAESSGVLFNKATIPGDTAQVCTSVPVKVCTGDQYTFELMVNPGRSHYRWFKDNMEITGQTTNVLSITTVGAYSLAIDNVTGLCADFSCCPYIVEEDTLPTFQAVAIPATCAGTTPQANGQLVLNNFRPGYTYQYSLGSDFNPAAPLSGAAQSIPTGGVIVNNLANPGAGQAYTVRVYNSSGCYTDVTRMLMPSSCCNLSLVTTAGLCTTATNTYSSTAVVTLTNPTAGTLTITDGPLSQTFVTTAASSATYTATFSGLAPNGASHNVTASLPGCSTTITTYTAPVSCSTTPLPSPTLALALTDPGVCQPGTNTYNTTGVISLTNAIAGTLTLTDGTASLTLSVSAGTTSLPYSLSGLVSGTGTHTVTVSFAGQSASTTYTAPASCSTAGPVCSLSATVTAGVCASATNTYSATAIVTVLNPMNGGTLTISNGTLSQPFTTTAGSSNTFTAIANGLVSDGAPHIITVSLPGCGSTSVTYTAPAACSVTPVCSINPVVTPGLCASATNTYPATAVVTLSNPPAGVLTVNTNGQSLTTTINSGLNSFTYTAAFTGLLSDGASHTLTASLPGCADQVVTYTAPASCSVTPVCSVTTPVLTIGPCLTATNTYSTTAVVTLTNPAAGVLTVSNGGQSLTTTIPNGLTSFTYTAVFNDLLSDGSAQTVIATLPGCGSATAQYTAPASCSVVPVCSLSATVTAGTCASATNTYSLTTSVTVLTPSNGGTLMISDGMTSQPFTTTAGGSNTFTAIFNGLVSDGTSHIITVTLPGCGSASPSYTAPAACSVTPVCSINPVVTPGLCASATNTYSATAVVTLTNPPAGVLTVSTSGQSLTTTIGSGLTSFTYTAIFDGLSSNGSASTITATLPGCGSATAQYTAPASCSATPVCAVGTPVVTAGVCNSATNTFSLTATVTVQNPVGGQTLSISNGTTSQPFATTAGTSNTFTMVFNGMASNGLMGTLTVSLPGCGSASAPYTAPASCSVTSVCSMATPVVTVGPCLTATNTYSATAVVTLTNPTAGVLTVSNGASSLTTTIASDLSSFTFTATFDGLASNGLMGTITATLPGCPPATAQYTAPASCSVTPVCSVGTPVVTMGVCNSATNAYSMTATVTLTNPTGGVLTVANGPASLTFAVPTLVGAATVSAIFNGLISDGMMGTITATLPTCGSATAQYTAPISCTPVVVCQVQTPTVTAGVCNSATNTFSSSVTVTVNNPVAGQTLTVNDGPSTLTFSTSAGTSNTFTATFNNLLSDGTSRPVTVSLPGCGSATTAYTAPASCSIAPVCSLSATVTAGACSTLTNTYQATVWVTLVNPAGGVLTITNGPASQTFAVPTLEGTVPVPATFNDLLSDGSSHTVIVSLPGCGSVPVQYTAPASCSVVPPVCSISTTATAGACSTATNTYSVTALVSITNPTVGVLTVSNGPVSLTTVVPTMMGTLTIPAIFDGLLSDGQSHTVTASLPGCSTTITTYTAPVSCSTTPLPSPTLALAVTDPGVCQPGTNTYNTTGVISLTNATAGTLTLTDGASSLTLSVSAGTTSLPYGLSGLVSGTGTHTVTVSFAGQSASTTYTAPGSCSVGSVCSLSAVVTAGTCSTATNTYSATAVVMVTNSVSGTVSVSTDGQTFLFNTTANSQNSFTAVFTGLVSDGVSRTLVTSLPGCGTVNTSYMAPASCSATPVCSVSATAVAVPVTCIGTSAQANGRIVLSQFQPGYTYQYSLGTSFNPAASLSGGAQGIPAGGIIVSNLTNPVVAQSYTVRVDNGSGCSTDRTVILQPTVCACPPAVCVPLVIGKIKRAAR